MRKLNLILAGLLFCLAGRAQNYTSDSIYMTMTTEKESGEWVLNLQPGSQAQNVWVDWNGNGQYDAGEENYSNVHAIDSKTITIYGQIVDMECAFNQLTLLDITHNPDLEVLFCQSNVLKTLDLGKSAKLNLFDCSFNQIKALDCSAMTLAEEIYCDRNLVLESLVLPATSTLTRVDCYINKLKNLDVSGLPNLFLLYCDDNELQSLDLSQNPKLMGCICSGNRIASLEVSHNTKLRTLKCDNNPTGNLDVDGIMQLSTLVCYSMGISGQDMDSLVASLNNSHINTPKQFVVFSNLPDENNECTYSQVAAAQEKEWVVMQDIFDESGNFISREPYGGCDGVQSYFNERLDHVVYPNPTTSIIRVEVSETLIGETISLLDTAGKCYLSSVVTVKEFDMDLSNYPSGLYFLKVGGQSVKVIRK